MRGAFSSLVRWLTVAVFGSRRFYFRPEQAEFPVAHQSFDFLHRPFPGRCAAGRASFDALRSTNNSVNIEDPNEISFIGETSATFARRFPPKGRSPFPSSRDAADCSEINLLATACGFFQQWQDRQKTSQCQSQRFIATASAAAATTARAAAAA